MKSGGPWNLRGLRPETREAARDAARRSGVSVGEWLNNVIREDDDDHGEPMRPADYDDDDEAWRDDKRRESRPNESRESRYDDRRARRRRGRPEQDEPPSQRRGARHGHDNDELSSRRRQREREAEIEREAALAREEFGEVHARLDRLTQQLERMAKTDAPRLTGAPAPQPQVYQPAPQPNAYQPAPQPHVVYQPPPPPRPAIRAAGHRSLASVDNAVAEIAQRQRQLYGDDAAARVTRVAPAAPFAAVASDAPMVPETPVVSSEPPPAAAAPPPLPPRTQQPTAQPAVDISNIEEQLRLITARIEALRPSSELESVVTSFRKDLAEIREQLTKALPRRAVESLEAEVQALAKRLDQSRASGIDLGVLAGIEGGLKEVRDALRNLTPAEKLVGFDDTVKALSQKVDLIIAKEDPAALQQLETAIGALRGIVSHVASNDTLTKVAEDVRLLAAKVDVVASSAASGQAVSALESRIDTLANALNASNEAGRAVPHELEKLLSGLIEKLEWVQLTHTDHAALGALEDRIAQLIKRLDASDARLGNLEAVERGMADLLVHIDQIRGGNGVAAAATPRKPVDAIERDVAEIKRSERRTQDSLEAVHGTVEHVVDRLAMIESGINDGASRANTLSDTPTAQEASKAPAKNPHASPHRIVARRRSRRQRPRPRRRPHPSLLQLKRPPPTLPLSRPLRHRRRHSPTPRRGAAPRAARRSIRICRPIIRWSPAPQPAARAPCRRPPNASRRRKPPSTSSSRRSLPSRAPSRISSPRPGARRRPPPRRRPSGRRAAKARRSTPRNRRSLPACAS